MSQNNDLATVQQGGITVDYTAMFSDARIQMVRDTIAQGAPESVFMAMIDIAKTRRLDPLAKQIICAKFGGTWQYVVTIDGYRSIAEQTGQYAGNDAPIFTWADPPTKNDAGKLVPETCTVTVRKFVNGTIVAFSATIYVEEFDTGRNNWLSMPKTMASKVAESHALRKAFPAVLSGTYTNDEMEQAQRDVVDTETGEVTREPTQMRRAPAPQAARPKPSGDAEVDRKRQMIDRAHARIGNLDAIHNWAASLNHGSVNDATIPELSELLNWVSKPQGLAEFKEQFDDAVEAEFRDVASPEPVGLFDPDADAALKAEADRIQRAKAVTR